MSQETGPSISQTTAGHIIQAASPVATNNGNHQIVPYTSSSSMYPRNASLTSNGIIHPHYKKQSSNLKRTFEEEELLAETASRFHAQLLHDQTAASHPDVDSPFIDKLDVINRLLPYHIFKQPKEDLRVITTGKGKGKACEAVHQEIVDTEFAIECYKRREAILQRWRKLRVRSGKRSAPDDQAYYLAQVVLDSDRSENVWLGNEVRNARAEAERIEREKRMAANAARMTQFPSVPQTAMSAMQPPYYRAYSYPFTQAYGAMAPTPSMSTFQGTSSAATSYSPYQANAPIPVQLPVASLPALHALGIIPVPAASLPPEGQQQPPAVLRGSSANGSILSLEINVSLLQSTQMTGLAMVLNSLVSRNSAATPGTTPPTQSTASKSTNS